MQRAQSNKGGLPLQEHKDRCGSPSEDPSADDESVQCRRSTKGRRSLRRDSPARSRSASTARSARASSRRDASPPVPPAPRKLAKPAVDAAVPGATAGKTTSPAPATAEEAIQAAQWQKAATTVKELLDIVELNEEPPLTKLDETQAWTIWAASQQCVTVKNLNAALQENEIECKDRAKVGKLRRLLWFAVGL